MPERLFLFKTRLPFETKTINETWQRDCFSFCSLNETKTKQIVTFHCQQNKKQNKRSPDRAKQNENRTNQKPLHLNETKTKRCSLQDQNVVEPPYVQNMFKTRLKRKTKTVNETTSKSN